MSESRVRPLRPEEIPQFVGLSYYAFNGRAPTERERDFGRRIQPGRNCLVATEGASIVSQVMIYELSTWIDGALYPTGGLANVATVPELTRRGHASSLLRATIAWMRDELGECLSMLYPTMFPLYRKLGWALADDSLTLAGEPSAFRPADFLPSEPGGGIDRHQATAADVELLEPLYRAFVRERSGYLERPRWLWEDMVLRIDSDDPRWVALWRDDDGSPGGYVVYALQRSPEIQLHAWEVVATTPAAYAALLTFLSAHHLWNRVTINAGRDVPWRSLVANPQLLEVNVRDRGNFMLRVIDLPAALALRRASSAAEPVVLEVRDEAAPWNDGTWRLDPRGDAWGAERVDLAPSVSTDIANFSALFDGFLTVPEAIASGALRADASARPALESLFVTRFPPTCRDHF